jgi:hypothetical protein
MSAPFQYQGFGVLSEWNGQVSSAAAQQAMQSIAATGANSIEITPRIWTKTVTSNDVIAEPAKTESDASLIAGIQNAQHAGLKVVLKPNLSTLDGHTASALAPSDVAAFFASYKAEIVHLATIAQQTGVAVLALGNEMSSLSGAQYQSYWLDIIGAVRAVYGGELTYAAATDEASKVSFWSALDVVGVNTYPPLAVPPGGPTVADLVAGWSQVPSDPYWAAAFQYQSPIDFLHSLSMQYGKPVLMTEAGYRSMDYGSTITGSWKTSGPMDLQEQADAYKAFLEVWTAHGGSWLKGVEFWQWDMNNVFSPTGFSPMGKPAQAIVTEYFKGGGALASQDVTTLTADQIASLGALGIKTIVASDHTVDLSAAQKAALGSAGISLSEPYGSDGAQTITWNPDGSLHDIHYYVVSGQSYTDYDVVYSGNGQTQTISYPNGETETRSYNPDGSLHDVLHAGITGHPYTTYDVLYGPGNKPVSASYSDGMSATWSYNPDGSLHDLAYAGIVGQRWTSSDTIYGANGRPASASWHNGAVLVQTETWNADGTVHDIHYYGVTGQPYTDFDVLYGSNGKPAGAVYSNGMTVSCSYNSNGMLLEVTADGITGQPWTSSDTIYGANGKPSIEFWHNGATLVQSETWNADGTVHDVHYYGITGHDFADYDVIYGANGKPASAVYSNGMTETWSYNPDGSRYEVAYAGVTGANYTSYVTGYGENGRSVVQEFTNAATEVETVRGLADHLTFAVSHTGVGVATGQSFAFASSTNTVLTGGGSDETFVFAPQFGHATITDFVPSTQANANHDTVQFSSAAFASFADLMTHTTQFGSNTVITDHAGDTLVLQHVTASQLTEHDFVLV